MQKLTKDSMPLRTNHEISSRRCGRGYEKCLGLLLLATTLIVLSACGGGSPSGGSQQNAALSGNWQFAISPPSGYQAPQYGLLGGFLLETNGSVTGQAVYSITVPGATAPCNAGTAALTNATITGQTVSLTFIAGDASNNTTFTLAGSLGTSNGQTMITGDSQNSSSAVTTPTNGTPCDTAQQNLSWSATLVPSLTGPIQGSFHSTAPASSLTNQDFPVWGSLTQSPNIGASNATVTGSLSFLNPETNLGYYPCFSTASVNGQISGSSVVLQIIGTNGATIGQIGGSSQVTLEGVTMTMSPATFSYTQSGAYVLRDSAGTGFAGYAVGTAACSVPTQGNIDSGNLCLALNNSTACTEPITLSPGALTFSAQTLNPTPTTQNSQAVTITNNSGAALTGLGLTLTLNPNITMSFSANPYSDFNGAANFQVQDSTEQPCVPPGGEILTPGQNLPFSLSAAASCQVTVSFTPQESCPWLPFVVSGNENGQGLAGASPQYCPIPLTAELQVSGAGNSSEGDTSFSVPISGSAFSALQPSLGELDFSAEEPVSPAESSIPQTVSLTNNGTYPVQILGRADCASGLLPHSGLHTRTVPGLQVLCNGGACPVNINSNFGDTIGYACDIDSGTFLSNFQISADSCTGTTLYPPGQGVNTCSVQIAYVPQPNTVLPSGGLDYFLELNTLQCYGSQTSNCEIDSGRLPVELKANGPSPLRMSPGAGLDFGKQQHGTTSAPQAITLLNDPNLATTQTVTLVGKIQLSGSSYSESDNCPAVLNPGDNCTISVTFTPGSAGFKTGTLTINYTQAPSGGSPTLGNPQNVYLRGTGQ